MYYSLVERCVFNIISLLCRFCVILGVTGNFYGHSAEETKPREKKITKLIPITAVPTNESRMSIGNELSQEKQYIIVLLTYVYNDDQIKTQTAQR